MPKPRVVFTRPIPEESIVHLREDYHVIIHEDWLMNKNQLMEFVKGADVLVCMLTDPVDGDVMDAAGKQLKLIASYNVGFDNIDLDAAKERDIAVTNTAGLISGPAVAEHAIALMFAVGRHMLDADKFMRKGHYKNWEPNLFLGELFSDKKVGIIGTGQIGSFFARMCHFGFGMKVLYTDMVHNERLEQELGAKKVSKERLLILSDVVSLHVPLLPSTRHLISKNEFHIMKANSILINTSRGPVVDEKALLHALEKKLIFGAGIDVFEFEPKVIEGLEKLDNVVVTPHIASATLETRIDMAHCVIQNIKAVYTGHTPPNLVKI